MATKEDNALLQKRVNKICNELAAQGKKVSVRVVRDALELEFGESRSVSTMHKYYAVWQKEVAANEQSLYDRLGFSGEFTQAFLKEITRFSFEAEKRYKGQATDASEQRDEALNDLNIMENRLSKQSAVVEQQEKEIRRLEAELFRIEEKLKAQLAQEQENNAVKVEELKKQIATKDKENSALSSSNG